MSHRENSKKSKKSKAKTKTNPSHAKPNQATASEEKDNKSNDKPYPAAVGACAGCSRWSSSPAASAFALFFWLVSLPPERDLRLGLGGEAPWGAGMALRRGRRRFCLVGANCSSRKSRSAVCIVRRLGRSRFAPPATVHSENATCVNPLASGS